jgi:glycerol kinase
MTNERETTVLWDHKNGAPLYNAIVWQDKRTANYCEELDCAGLAERI